MGFVGLLFLAIFVLVPLIIEFTDRRGLGGAFNFGGFIRAIRANPKETLAAGGLGAGLALSFARGLGEFGATIMFAGSLQGVTQTLSLAIYAEFARNFDVALAMGALLVAFSFILLLVVKWLSFGWTSPFRSVLSSSA